MNDEPAEHICRNFELLSKDLRKAQDVWDGKATLKDSHRKDGPHRELVAARFAAAAFADFLLRVDPEDEAHHRAPVMALARALDDLVEGREPPAWIRRRPLMDRGPDPLAVWTVRATVSYVLQVLIDIGLPKKRAEKLVFDLLQRHNFPVKSKGTPYRWLTLFRSSDRTPEKAQNIFNGYRDQWQAQRADNPEVDPNKLLQTLAEHLIYRGYHASTET